MAENDYRELKACRICGGNFDSNSLKLVDTPLANELYTSRQSSLKAEKFPLELVICKDCSHVQLKHIVSSSRLFSNYVYRSGTSNFFRQHFTELASTLQEFISVGSLVIEVGSNDGFLLGRLQDKGLKALGIEPSEQLAHISRESGATVINDYLSPKIVEEITMNYGKASAVVGNNVFAHIDNLLLSFQMVNALLEDGGVFIFEVADFEKLVEKGLFDTIYHEHMSYHTTIGLLKLAELSDFSIEKVNEIEPHGGSLRFLLRKGRREQIIGESVEIRLEREKKLGLDSSTVFATIANTILEKKKVLNEVLSNSSGQLKYIGYGAPAKLVTFCYQMGLTTEHLEYVIDDNEFKQNHFVPGLGYEVVSSEKVEEFAKKELSGVPLAFIVFPWNLGPEIIEKLSKWAPSKSYIVKAFPAVEIRNLN